MPYAQCRSAGTFCSLQPSGYHLRRNSHLSTVRQGKSVACDASAPKYLPPHRRCDPCPLLVSWKHCGTWPHQTSHWGTCDPLCSQKRSPNGSHQSRPPHRSLPANTDSSPTLMRAEHEQGGSHHNLPNASRKNYHALWGWVDKGSA